MNHRLGVFISHPIQYYTPWFRQLAGCVDLQVFYAHQQTGGGQSSAGFGVEFDWDIPLLDGYQYRWLTNVSRRPGVRSFGGLDTPELYQLIRKERFDAFLVFGWNHKGNLQAIRACKRNGVPVLIRGDSQLITGRSLAKSAIKYFPYRWLLPKLDVHLYVGRRNRDYLRHYGVPEDHLVFAPHFVDNHFFSEASRDAESEGKVSEVRRKMCIPEGGFVFLFAGKMIPKKRTEDFIRACLSVLDSSAGRNVHALIVGDGPLRDGLERLASCRADRIHFAGFRNQTEMPSYYASSDALVLPSNGEETWGLAVNESFACGVPAVVSEAVGCAPDLIDEGRTGYTFPVGDVEGLALRMLMLKHLCDHDPVTVRRALADKIASYSMGRATEGLNSALERVVQCGRAIAVSIK